MNALVNALASARQQIFFSHEGDALKKIRPRLAAKKARDAHPAQ